MSDFLSALQTLQYPQTTAFNPNQYQSLIGSPEYAANMNSAKAQSASQAQNEGHLAGGANAQANAGYNEGMAQTNALGAAQPQSGADQLAQWQLQNQVRQANFGAQNAQQQELQGLGGSIAGTAGGYAMGALGNSQFGNALNSTPGAYNNPNQPSPYASGVMPSTAGYNPYLTGANATGPLAGY